MTDRRAIFISGGASGIGLATAKHFAAKGWFVGMGDIDAPALQAAQDAIGAGRAFIHALDVRSRSQWNTALAAFTSASGGKLDALVNNAGIAPFGWFETIDPDANDRMVDINIKGVINGAYAGLPYLRATPGSRLINIASCAGLYGSPRLAVYSATKFAVRGLSEALDVEFARHGVAVSCVMPWFVDTAILDGEPGGPNARLRDMVTTTKQKIYTVEDAAGIIFQAAHGTQLHHIVGAAGRSFHRMARHVPALVRRTLKKNQGKEALLS